MCERSRFGLTKYPDKLSNKRNTLFSVFRIHFFKFAPGDVREVRAFFVYKTSSAKF